MTTIENLAGVPGAAELTALANALFPDLTESAYSVPEVNVSQPGISTTPIPESVTGETAGIPAAVTPVPEAQSVSVPESASNPQASNDFFPTEYAYIPAAYERPEFSHH